MILKIVIGLVAGGVLGFGYYKLVGCSSGTCPLTSNPWTSTIIGMLLGAVLGADARKSNTTKHHEKQNKQHDN